MDAFELRVRWVWSGFEVRSRLRLRCVLGAFEERLNYFLAGIEMRVRCV